MLWARVIYYWSYDLKTAFFFSYYWGRRFYLLIYISFWLINHTDSNILWKDKSIFWCLSIVQNMMKVWFAQILNKAWLHFFSSKGLLLFFHSSLGHYWAFHLIFVCESRFFLHVYSTISCLSRIDFGRWSIINQRISTARANHDGVDFRFSLKELLSTHLFTA